MFTSFFNVNFQKINVIFTFCDVFNIAGESTLFLYRSSSRRYSCSWMGYDSPNEFPVACIPGAKCGLNGHLPPHSMSIRPLVQAWYKALTSSGAAPLAAAVLAQLDSRQFSTPR